MPFVPEATTDDHFYYIIRIPQYYYNKYFKLSLNVSVLISVYYFSMLFYNFNNVNEDDLFFTATILEVFVARITLDSLQEQLIVFNTEIQQKFWSNSNLLIDFSREKKLFGSFLLLLVFTGVVAFVLMVAIPITLPRCIYNENWNLWFKVVYKTVILLYVLNGIYISITNDCYCVYVMLHYRFQMKILTKYIKREMGNYKRMQLLHKFYSELYQEEVRQILLRSVKQYQILKIYGQKITTVYNKAVLLFFLIGVITIALGIHSVVFNSTKNAPIILTTTLHGLLMALLFTELGQMFSTTSDELYTALTELEWYTFKKHNRKMYYMFIGYTQKSSVVAAWSSMITDRALFMQMLRTVYSVIAVLKSVNKF